MNELESYLKKVSQKHGENVGKHLEHTVQRISKDCIINFDYTKATNAVLLGHVQSGKTGNLIGLVANSIDHQFKFFIVFTTDSILLYQQTIERFQDYLSNAVVCGENDEDKFFANSLKMPTVLVIKKNQSVLRKWLGRINRVAKCSEEPLIIIDDEADAASLNTLVNKNDVSTINGLIRDFIKVGPSSLYLQTTATPFANLLLSENSTTKPKFITRFEPSEVYMGGEYFYGEDSHSFEIINEEDSKLILDENEMTWPSGLVRSLSYFIGHIILNKRNGELSSNFLIHPSHKISDHRLVYKKIEAILSEFSAAVKTENTLILELIPSLTPHTKNNLTEISDALSVVKVLVVNSESELPSLEVGFHVIIGGNCLGRGLTIPQLNVCLYTRNVKSPQADTLLQHSRIFGYDRDRKFAKVFLPRSMLLRFRGIVKAVSALHQSVDLGEVGKIKYFLPPKVNPTRKNVIDKSSFISLTGGVNYFLESSKSSCTSLIDGFLDSTVDSSVMTASWLIDLLEKIESEDDLLEQFKYAVKILINSDMPNVTVYIRRDRNISRGTGTLLSPDDRLLSHKSTKNTVVFLYRLTGQVDKGWSGQPFWIPNLRFPNDCVFIGNES